ncbi:MAG: divergent PAP2 family protein [Dehalococcoidia bacterium]|nr:divergent PAP2 family protein [Dehalococcoidia bacterium]
MDNVFDSLIHNKSLIIPVGVWCIAQGMKLFITLLRDKRLDFSRLVAMGGMPSAHTGLVCALATTIARTNGVDSPLFAISAIFAAVVVYDAAGLRRSVSIQASILNQMIDELFKGKPVFEQRLREFIGHTRFEVLIGAILGILASWLLTI